MKLSKVLGKVVKVAGPVASGFAVGGPVGGALALAGQVSGAVTKEASKASASNAHQAAAPAAAVAVPTVIAVALEQLGLPGVELSNALCADGAQAGALIGLLAAFSHQAGHGLEKSSAG